MSATLLAKFFRWGSTALLTTALVALATSAAQAGPPYGSIAYGAKSERWGLSNDQPTQALADQQAITFCNAPDCSVVDRFQGGQCGAVATSVVGVGGFTIGWGTGNRTQASDNALSNCTVRLALCSVDSAQCNAGSPHVGAPTSQPQYAPAPIQAQYAPIVAAHSGKCIDVPNGSTANNVGINQFRCDGSNEQNFSLRPAGAGYYNIVAAHSGKCLDVPNGTLVDNVQINQFQCDGSNEQKFQFRPAGAGHYNIVAAHSGKCLDVPNGATADNVQINQFQCDGSNEQRFRHAAVASARAPVAPPPPAYAPPPSAPNTGWTGRLVAPDGEIHRVSYDLNAVGTNGQRFIAMRHIDRGEQIDLYAFTAWPTTRTPVINFKAIPPGKSASNASNCSMQLLKSNHIAYQGQCVDPNGDRATLSMDGP